ncbi:MAG: histidine phosphotransferase [Paracoccaceae bacterium]
MGAISNGLELLTMSGLQPSPELTLLQESVENANAKIRFFRVALGAASGTQLLARSEILSLLDGCYGGGRLKVRWHPACDPSRRDAKTVFLALMCIETTLTQGGEIAISEDRGAWSLHAYGPKIRFEAPLWAMLEHSPETEISSAQVQFALLRSTLDALGLSAQVGHSESAVSLKF